MYKHSWFAMSRFGAYDFDDNEADEDYVPPEDPEDDDDDDDDDDEEMALVEDEEDLPHHGVASVLQSECIEPFAKVRSNVLDTCLSV